MDLAELAATANREHAAFGVCMMARKVAA